MELLHSLIEAELTQRIGWTLIHFLWQAALIGIITTIILSIAKKNSPAARYRIAFSSLYIMVLISLITFKSISIEIPGIDNTNTADIVPLVIADVPINNIPDNEIVHQTPTPIQITTDNNTKEFKFEALTPYIALAWLGGISILSILHIGGWFQLQKLRWQTVKPVAESVKSQMNAYAKTLGISRAVNILESSLVQVPTVIGHFKPIILLPASVISGISSDQIASLLAHELAHIKRNDYLENIVQTGFEILGFFHPAVWWLSKKIRTERENCCDDLAIELSGSRIEYAKALTAMEELRSKQYKLAVAATDGNLYCRIRRLLIEDKNNERITSGIYSAMATLLIMGIILPCAFALATATDEKPDVMPVIVDGAQSYYVNKNVSEFTGPEDLSTPETAYVAICKVHTADDPKEWKRLSEERIAKAIDTSRKPNPNPNWANVCLHAKIREVHIKDDMALVVAELLQDYSDKPIRNPIDLRSFSFQNGKWLNSGNGRVNTIEQARDDFKLSCKLKEEEAKPVFQPEPAEQIQAYEVQKNVSEYTGPEDFSSPETAYVAINRVMATDNTSDWKRVSVQKLAKVFSPSRKANPNANWANVVSNAKIHGVIINGSNAVVIAEFLQEFSDKKIYQPIDARYLELENGKWLNTGQDRFNSIIEAKVKFKNFIDKNKPDNKPGLNIFIDQIDIDNDTPADIIKILGEPEKYMWDNQTFTKDNLPARYVMIYPIHLNVFVTNNYIVELRVEGPGDYIYGNALKFGSSLDEVIKTLGDPDETVTGKANKFKSNTLYKNIDGQDGYCYYAREDKNIRVWLRSNLVMAIYLTRSDYSDGGSGRKTYSAENLPPNSFINEEGHLVDKVNYPFETDPAVIGKWTSVDFVDNIDQFKPKRKHWGGELFLQSITFTDTGDAIYKLDNKQNTNIVVHKWTKGLLLGTNTASKYTVKEINGETYMFYEWKSGDYTIRHMHPCYYVLKKDKNSGIAPDTIGGNSRGISITAQNEDSSKPKISTEIRLIYSPEKIPLLPVNAMGSFTLSEKEAEELIKYTKNNASCRSVTAPSITTIDGEQANLNFSKEIVYVLDGQTIAEKQTVDEGVNIDIVSSIEDNNYLNSKIEYNHTFLANENTGDVARSTMSTNQSIKIGQTIVIASITFKDGYITTLIKPEIAKPVEPASGSGNMPGGMGGGMMGDMAPPSGIVGGMVEGFQPGYNHTITGPSVKTEVRIATLPNNSDLLKEIMQNPIIDDARANEIISLTKKDARSRLLTMPYCSTPDNVRSNFSFGETKLFITNHIALDKKFVRADIEYENIETGPDGIASSNSSATSLVIPSGKTCIVSGYNTADYATLLLIKVTINEAEETAKKEADNLEVVKIEFVPNVEMEQLAQGKNVLCLNVKNKSDKDRLFAVHIYTRSPDMGPDGIGWGTVFFETIPAKQTKLVKAPFKIQGPITDNTYVRLKYYNPASEEQYDYEKPFHEEKLNAAKINAVFAKDRTPGTLSKTEPVSKELTESLLNFQDLIRNKAYDKAWDMLTDDYQVSEYQHKGLDRFRKHMEPVQPLDDGFSWKKETFLNMKPAAMKARGQAAFQNKAYVYAETENEKWTIVFLRDENGQWKIDDITGYTPNVVNM